MKSIKFAILLVLIILTGNSQGDILITKRTIPTSNEITNVKDFPDVTFFAVLYDWGNSQKIEEDGSIGGPMHSVFLSSAEIYAVKNEYLTGTENEDIDWYDKRNVMKSNIVIPGYFENIAQSELKDVERIENKYTIVGFNDSTIVYKVEHIYKFKEKLQKADSIKWDDYVDSEEILSKTFN